MWSSRVVLINYVKHLVWAMDVNQAGPSGVKKRRVIKKTVPGGNTVRDKYPLTDNELEKYLLDSDDDIGDPDYNSDSSSNMYISENSDSEAEGPLDTTLDDSNSDLSSNIADVPQPAGIPPPLPQRPVNDAVIWNADEFIPTQIVFKTK